MTITNKSMAETNKTRLVEVGKVAAIMVAAMVAIASNSAVWNAVANGVETGFIAGVAVVNFLMEGGLIAYFAKKYLFKK